MARGLRGGAASLAATAGESQSAPRREIRAIHASEPLARLPRHMKTCRHGHANREIIHARNRPQNPRRRRARHRLFVRGPRARRLRDRVHQHPDRRHLGRLLSARRRPLRRSTARTSPACQGPGAVDQGLGREPQPPAAGQGRARLRARRQRQARLGRQRRRRLRQAARQAARHRRDLSRTTSRSSPPRTAASPRSPTSRARASRSARPSPAPSSTPAPSSPPPA